jgi:Family of unknown function (DUF6338)
LLPATLQALVVILLAIVPGYLAMNVWTRSKTWKGRGPDLHTVLQSVSISLVIQIAAAPLTVLYIYPVRTRIENYPWRVCIWSLLVVLVIPWVGGSLLAWLSDRLFQPTATIAAGQFRRVLAVMFRPSASPSIWDWAITSGLPDGRFIVIEYTDGHRIAGSFGIGSKALTTPEVQGMYISTEWSLDNNGDLVQQVPGTAGVVVLNSSSVRHIRLLQELEEPDEMNSGTG